MKRSPSNNSCSIYNYGDDDVSHIEVVDKSTHHVCNVYYYKDKIHTTTTHTASVVDEWIADVYIDYRNKLNNLVVGLGIEWSRTKDDCRNKVVVLQLCLSDRCLIFQLSHCDKIPISLDDFLSDERIIFVGAGINGDAYKLWVDHRLHVARTEELCSLADSKLAKTGRDYRERRFYKADLKYLAKEILNLELPKKRDIQLSNWEYAFLSDAQINSACLEAFVSFKLAIDLKSRANPVHIDERSLRDEPKKIHNDQITTSNSSTTSSSSTDRSSVYYGRDNVSSIEVVDKSESTHHTYNVYYYEDKIYTTVTHTAFVVDKWIADVYSELHEKNLNNLGVGLDMEWTRVTENQVAVLQLCLSGRCLIFQISCCDKIPKSLDAFLSDERIIFFGAGKDMVPKLLEDHGLKVSRIAELGCLAAYRFTNNFVDFRESRFHAAGLTTLAKKILSQELPGQRYIEMSNWDKEFLSDEQIEYACLNAFVAFKIATYLFDESH